MKVYFASDHAGFELKKALLDFVHLELSYEIVDCGALMLEPEDDYPPLVAGAARAVAEDAVHGIASCAIVIGGSGTGEAIVANKFRSVRACVFYGGNEEIVRLSREHNDANVLSLGARFMTVDEAKAAARLWLSTPFSGDSRHARRISQIDSVLQG